MKISQQIPRKASQHGKSNVKNTESEQHKGYLTTKPQEWNDINNKKLKGFGKQGSQSFDNHLYIFNGTERPKKLITWQLNIQNKVINGKEVIKMKHWYSIFNSILKLTNKSSKVIVQEIINKFLNPSHQIQKGKGEDLF